MAISKKMQDELNKQINAELWSAYMYLSMSSYFENLGFKGFANWMRVQFQEEQTHALKFFDYVISRGGMAALAPIDAVPLKWDSALNAFEETLKHEQHVTALINNLMDVAISEKDYATQSLLKWFIDEQVEEEANVNEIIDELKLLDGKGNGLFMIDRELRSRVFVDSTKTV